MSNDKKEKKDYAPNDDASSGQNPIWPGQGLRKPDETIKDDDGGETEIPLVR